MDTSSLISCFYTIAVKGVYFSPPKPCDRSLVNDQEPFILELSWRDPQFSLVPHEDSNDSCPGPVL